MQIGILADSYRCALEDVIAKAAEAGAETLQCYATRSLVADPARQKTLAREAERANVPFSAVVAELGGFGFQRADENPAKLDAMDGVFRAARQLGAAVVTGHIGVIPERRDDPRRDIMLHALSELGRRARRHGVVFGIETGPERPEILLDFLERLDGGVGVNFDPANLVMVRNISPVAAVETLHDWIVYTHAKDGVHFRDCDAEIVYDAFARGGFDELQKKTGELFAETPLGAGSVDFPSYLAALQRFGYRGALTIERETGSDPGADLALAVRFLKQQLAELTEGKSL